MTAIPLAAVSDPLCVQGIRLSRITLPEDHTCPRRDQNSYCRCVIRTGGDILRGSVEVLSSSNRSFTIEVRLEGVCRTWIQKGEPTSPPSEMAEHYFLQEIDIVKYRPSGTETSKEAQAQQLDFTFSIPRRLITAQSDVDPRFLELYPSAQFGPSCCAYPSRQRYMQPYIFYRIVAMIPISAKNAYDQAYMRNLHCERMIKIQPSKVADPPLYIRAYPDEYRLETSKKLRNHVYSPPIGDLHVSAEEPMPLNLAVSTPRASTNIPVKLSFSAKDSSTSSPEPYNWTVAVQSRVRLRIFYSTRALTHEPTLQDMRSSHLATRTELTKEEMRYYHGLQWGVDRLSRDGTTVKQSDVLRSPCTSRLYATVSVPKSFVPSFLTPLAALRYSVILKITVLGMKSSSATIEVPVQVHRCPVPSPTDGLGDETQRLSEVRNLSSLWEGGSGDRDGVIVNQLEEQPPPYSCQV